MMWIASFFLFFFFTLKDFNFVSNFFCLDSFSMFMYSIMPLTMLIIFFFFFNNINFNELLSYRVSFFFVLFFVALTFILDSPFFFLLFLELCVYPMVFLILNFSKDQDKFSSVLFMFSLNILGSIPFMIFSQVSSQISSSLSTLSYSYFFFSDNFFLICFLLILLSKLPLIFFHFWLTKAHVSASGSCSMILASLMLKLGSFGLFKFFFLFSFFSLFLVDWFLSISLFGCIFFCFLMMRFVDLKYLIACSSILHMSLIFPLIFLGSPEMILGSMFMMTGHGLVSYFLFFLVSILYEFSFSRSTDLNKSVESFSKFFSMFFFLMIFLNIGFPPFINFFSEMLFCLSLSIISYCSIFLFLIVMLSSVIFSMFISTKILFGKKFSFNFVESEGFLNYSFFLFLFSLFFLPFLS